MRMLIIGSGGREHAMAWKLKQSPLVNKLIIAPGNGGTAILGENVNVDADDLPGIVSLCKERNIDMVVAGPELPLVLGLKDALEREGVMCFGPSAFCAQLEGSKAFAKRTMRAAGAPTAAFEVFDDYDQAKDYLQSRTAPIVVKADGLAAGKGVIVAKTMDEAMRALEDIMVRKVFGSAGNHVVIEEALTGQEASFMAFCDGTHVVPLPSSQDHKPIGEGDTGPNTGGMGAYSPAPILPESRYQEMADMVIAPITRFMASREAPFVGMLYAGLMIDGDDIHVLEYNVRFGDPECQPLLSRLDTDLAEIMLACCQGRLHEIDIKWKPETAICVVMAAEGYPASYPKGMEITGLDEAEELDGVTVFHAGTKLDQGKITAAGGRVLGVTSLGKDLAAAQKTAYAAVDRIHFDNSYVRRDIGAKGLA